MNIADLDLAEPALSAAKALLAAHPAVLFTSGRRSVDEQASAMAGNIVSNRRWIAETYVSTYQAAQLQAWVAQHPEAARASAIAQGLAAIMTPWTDAQKGALSKHFSGEAFDVQPMTGPEGDAVMETIRSLPHLTKFLTREGGLTRWHAQFA